MRCKGRHFILNYKHLMFFMSRYRIYHGREVSLQSCLNNNFMIEQFNFDIRLIFAILNGKVSAAINRKLSRNFRQNGLEITPEQWTVLIFLWEKTGSHNKSCVMQLLKTSPA